MSNRPGRLTVGASCGRADRPGAHDLFVMDRDGAHKHRLAGGPGNDIDPAWSPDGTRIAFASNRSGRYQLWLVGSSGGTPELLTTPGRARAPDWSPTGNRLAYTGIVGAASDVWMVSLDGFTHRRLTSAPAFDGRPNWSPDGRRLTFVSERGRRAAHLADAGRRHAPAAAAGLAAGRRHPEWSILDAAIAPSASELLPDLDQRAPSGLVVMARGREHGPRLHVGRRQHRGRSRSTSEARVSGPLARCGRTSSSTGAAAGCASCAGVGRLAYEPHPPHHHWHLQPYERYELRRARDDAFVARDTQERLLPARPLGPCPAAARASCPDPSDSPATAPPATRRRAGSRRDHRSGTQIATRRSSTARTSTSRASPPASTCSSIVRTREGRIRELRYSNNAASVLIRLAPDGRAAAPGVEVLRRCESSERCPAGPVAYDDDVSRYDVLVAGAGPAGSATATPPRARRSAGAARRPRPVPARQAVRRRDHGSRAPSRLPCDVSPVVEHIVRHVRAPARYGRRFRRSSDGAADPDDAATSPRRVSRRAGRGGRGRVSRRRRASTRSSSADRRRGDRWAASRSRPTCSSAPTAPTASSPGQPASSAGIVRGVALEGNVAVRTRSTESDTPSTAVIELGAPERGLRLGVPEGRSRQSRRRRLGRARARACAITSPALRRPTASTRTRSPTCVATGCRCAGSAPRRPRADRVLLVGDAAGLVDPLSGDGIYEAFDVGAPRRRRDSRR